MTLDQNWSQTKTSSGDKLVDLIAENVDRLKFLGTFSLAQKISTRTIISLDPLATNAWFYDSQSMAVR